MANLKIITGIYMKVNTMFLVPGHQSEKNQKNHFYCLLNVQEVEAMSKKLICYCKTVFWAKNSKIFNFFKPFGLDPLPRVTET